MRSTAAKRTDNLVSFPNCKINLGLHIVERRSDGYHNLETVFYPLSLTDILEIVTAEEQRGPRFSLSGLPIPGEPAHNLCFKAWQLLKNDFPTLPPVTMHLHKKIPMGAGLGGGSADGAFALTMLNEKYELGLSTDSLSMYALQLGSDCPFFIFNKPAFARGRGEILEPLQLDLTGNSFLLIDPGVHISTAQAFSQVRPRPGAVDLSAAIQKPLNEWKDAIRNDFEESAFYFHPELRAIRGWLYETGAVYAAMSGSGSCFYGIYKKNQLPQPSTILPWQLHYVP
jgi:4-diphosphocytidyl-2-C-methyl-D-erythritol kinase